MKQTEQRRIIRELCKSHQTLLLTNAHKLPAEWDGVEIRQWFADTARTYFIARHMQPSRKRAYNAVCVDLP